MKKAISALLSLLLCLGCSLSARAYAPKIVDYALYTDIVAKINGHPLRSYNISGYTAVVAEDLRGYGFEVVWNGAERTLRITRALKDGEPETPAVWPDYTPEPLTHKIGARAKPVYETDIVTYAAGDFAEAFNVNGETLVFIDSLSPFGSVEWRPDERVIELTLGDPVAIALEPMIESVESWKALGGAGSGYETYACPTGTLLVARYTGTPHGTSTNMLFLKKNGEQLSINDLLPAWPTGSGSYLSPSEVTIDNAGRLLRFVTPVRELTDYPDGEVRELGKCRCTVDLLRGTLLSLEPLAEIAAWELTLSTFDEDAVGQTLSITVKRSGSQILATETTIPGTEMMVSMNASGVRIVHNAALLENEDFKKTDYYTAFQALRELGLPSVTETNDIENTPQQRTAASAYFQLTQNGNAVSGNLWWSQGNNHVDLNYGFDQPLMPEDGDSIVLTVGLFR